MVDFCFSLSLLHSFFLMFALIEHEQFSWILRKGRATKRTILMWISTLRYISVYPHKYMYFFWVYFSVMWIFIFHFLNTTGKAERNYQNMSFICYLVVLKNFSIYFVVVCLLFQSHHSPSTTRNPELNKWSHPNWSC